MKQGWTAVQPPNIYFIYLQRSTKPLADMNHGILIGLWYDPDFMEYEIILKIELSSRISSQKKQQIHKGLTGHCSYDRVTNQCSSVANSVSEVAYYLLEHVVL